jgi:hypothetical protein
MPTVRRIMDSPPLETNSQMLRPRPILSSTIYQSASIVFIIISVLFTILLCYHVILYKRMSPSLGLPNSLNEKQDSKRLQTALTTAPAHNETLSLHQDHQSPLDLSDLPEPTMGQFQQPFPNALALADRTVTMNKTCVIGLSPRSVTRRDTVQDMNGCRRHVMVLG